MNEDIGRYIDEEPLGCCFDDISGRDFWKSILGSYWHVENIDEALELPSVQCVLLHGPFGSGKNTLLQAMAGEMIQGGYKYLELDFDKIPKEKIRPVFKQLKSEYIQAGPIFLFLNHLERFKDARVLWNFFESASSGSYPLIMAGVVSDDNALPSDVRKLFHAYYIGLPEREDRKAYFKDNLEELFDNSSYQGMEKLLDGTEGCNYVQMESLAQQIKMRVKYEILKNGKDLEIAMSWMEADLIEEVLAKNKLPSKQSENHEDLTAMMQAILSAQTVQEVQEVKEQSNQREMNPLDDLRAKYGPKKVFDQGLMFVKE